MKKRQSSMHLGESIRRRFAPFGGVELTDVGRESRKLEDMSGLSSKNIKALAEAVFEDLGSRDFMTNVKKFRLVDTTPVFFDRGLYAMTGSMLRGLRKVVARTSPNRGEFLRIQTFSYEDEVGPGGIDAESLADKRAFELRKALQTLGYGGVFLTTTWGRILPANHHNEPVPAEISILGPGEDF